MKPDYKYLNVKEKKFYYGDYNNGEIPLLYIPGWLPLIDKYPYSKIFSRKLPEISRGYRFIIVNLSNLYKSTFSSTAMNLDDYAEDIRCIIEILGYKKVHLMGHSAGGRFTIHFAAKYPQMVEKLILLNSAGLNHKSASEHMLDKANFYFGKLVVTPNQLSLLKESFKNIYNTDLRDEMKALEHKTLVIWGANDKTIPVKKAYIFKKYLQNSELKIFPKMGHMTVIKPDVHSIIFEFLNK